MKRLTYMCGGKWRLRIGDTEYSGKVVDRLAAYEGTGLEPEEIYAVKVVRCKDCKYHNKPRFHMDRENSDDFCSRGKERIKENG